MHQIGIGVLGPVFRTYDPDRDRLVAVKAFTVDFTREQASLFVDSLKEIIEVGLVHPAIVEPLDAGLQDGTPFIAQEYVTAEPLNMAVRHYAPAQPQRLLTFVRQLAAAVDFAHARGIVHGTMHLQDVFVTPDNARTTGFGVASALEHVGLRVPVRPPYTAPEMIAGRRWGPDADKFAVAAIAYELLTGKPVAGPAEEVLVRLLQVETADLADLAGLQQAFRNALAEDPALRPASAMGFVGALGDALEVNADDTKPAEATSDRHTDTAINTGLLHDNTPEQKLREESDGIVLRSLHHDRDLEEATGSAQANLDVMIGHPVEELTSSQEEADATEPVSVKNVLGEMTVVESETPEFEIAAGDTEPHDDEVARGFEEETNTVASIRERELLLPLEPEAPIEASKDRPETKEEVEDYQKWVAPNEPSEMTVGDAIAAHAADVADLENEEPTFTAPEVRQTKSAPLSEDRVPPLPSKTSIRAMLQVAVAMAIGVLVAYVVSVGLGTTDDDYTTVSTGVATNVEEPLVPTLNVDETAEPTLLSEQFRDGASDDVSGPPDVRIQPFTRRGQMEPVAQRSIEIPSSTEAFSEALGAPASVEPGVGWLLVRTVPPGATVRIDGRDRGVAPMSLADIPHGTYRLEVTAPGYASQEREVAISSDSSVAAVSVVLARTPEAVAEAVVEPGATLSAGGSVYVDSRPTGAAVFIDEERVGVTPILVPDVAVGSHEVRIEGEGYLSWTTIVTVRAAQRTRVAASLEAGNRR